MQIRVNVSDQSEKRQFKYSFVLLLRVHSRQNTWKNSFVIVRYLCWKFKIDKSTGSANALNRVNGILCLFVCVQKSGDSTAVVVWKLLALKLCSPCSMSVTINLVRENWRRSIPNAWLLIHTVRCTFPFLSPSLTLTLCVCVCQLNVHNLLFSTMHLI